jgi:high affinity Mn2+ porin
MNLPARHLALFLSALLLSGAAAAQEPAPAAQSWNARLQASYVWQAKPAFPAAYSGVNSLSPDAEKSYSFTSTAYLGLRLAADTELYFNPELVQGVAMSRLTGLGGLSNAELQKTAGSSPTLYRARLFVRQTWGLGGEMENVAPDANQLGGRRDSQRVVLTVGNLAVSDIFDANSYAHDPRTQFMNWSFLTHGAYDFAADSRGYSIGAALEYYGDGWAWRAGRFMQPKESNGLALDHSLLQHYGDQLELEKAYSVAGRPGKARLLLFRNRAVMGSFADALAAGGVPDIAPVRQLRSKRGWGINLEQSLSGNTGVFARLARSDGASEAYAFAEIDRSLSSGVTISGAGWGRARDTLAVAYARNGLSATHQAFLAAGGSGFFVGDGRLNYRPEAIIEGYYSIGLSILKRSALSLGLQSIRNPGYNADRGPVRVVSVRLHTEF